MLAPVAILASEPAPKPRVGFLGPSSLTMNAGLTYEYFLTVPTGATKTQNFGPVEIWKTDGGEYIQVTGALSVLDVLCRTTLEDEHKRGYQTDPLFIVSSALGIFDKIGIGGQLVPPGTGSPREQYLDALAKNTTADRYKELVAMLALPQKTVDGKNWKISYSIVTDGGAIERHSFSGELNPLKVKKSEIELIAPKGTVPVFVFSPENKD